MKGSTLTVPYFDLTAQYEQLRDEILAGLDRLCRSSSFILGEEVEQFERELADYCGAKHCVALNSGTSAVHLALLAAGVGPGDEVITTPSTFIATAEAVSYTGATPVFVDVLPETANIDPSLIEHAITKRTKAIMPVHLYGRPAELDPILAIAEQHGLPVIEDACQAVGATYRRRPVGSFGLASTFSFYPPKNLGAYGEGGALTTNDDRVAELARSLRAHGERTRYHHDAIGFNYRMDSFQGSILRIKLRHLDGWTARRQELAGLYRELLADTNVEIPVDSADAESVYHLFVVWVDDRDAVRAALEERGVETAIHYPIPVHLQPAYASLGHAPGSFPHTERGFDRVLSLPLYPEMPDEHVEYAAKILAEIAS
jgi:dTDP-4-amino-4,6-dideoxygalactose transaminase